VCYSVFFEAGETHCTDHFLAAFSRQPIVFRISKINVQNISVLFFAGTSFPFLGGSGVLTLHRWDDLLRWGFNVKLLGDFIC
jgi:hypothetical protein